MADKPLQMPKLDDLPNPVGDLFGNSVANPTSLMQTSQKEYDSLFHPKPLELPKS